MLPWIDDVFVHIAVFPSYVRLSSGPLILVLACDLWKFIPWLILASFQHFWPNSHAHNFRPSSMEFINKSSYPSIYSF